MEQWVFDGGRKCLDLVNTLRDRYDGGRELLTGPAALADWLVRAELLPRRVPVSAEQVRLAVTLREVVDRVVRHRGRPADVRVLNRLARQAPVPQLRVRDGVPERRAVAADPVTGALGALAVDAIDLVASGVEARICAAEDCGLRFASPRPDRQWCSMSRCGNRAKARAHYARRHGR